MSTHQNTIRKSFSIVTALGLLFCTSTLYAQDMDHSSHDMEQTDQAAPAQPEMDHSAMDDSAMDHSAMDHSTHQSDGVAKGVMVMEMSEFDEDGRRFGAMDHDHLSVESIEALREAVNVYTAFTDDEIRINMSLMGPNYEWYVSEQSLEGDVGVLILCHGVGELGDRMFKENVMALGQVRPTTIGFGMAMMTSSPLQKAVDDLVAKGAKKIVLVPTVPTIHNSLFRQWAYTFGLSDEASYLPVPPIQTEAEIIMADAYNDSPLLTDVLFDYAKEISTNPSNEVVVIVAHGPEDYEDNIPDLANLDIHANRLKEMDDFVDVKAINLQDDAFAPIRAANVKQLRKWVQAAERRGQDVIVLGYVLESHGLQPKIQEDLRGLKFTFNTKGLIEHEKMQQWIADTVDSALARTAQETPTTEDTEEDMQTEGHQDG